jgi:hypothetical protein
MRDAAIALTVEDNWPTGLSVSTENSSSVGFIRVNVCNVTGADIDPPATTVRWVAFAPRG